MATQHPVGGGQFPPITLSDMMQRREMRTAAEDWTGTTSSAQRRKLQNRLNQRAYYASAYTLDGYVERMKASRRKPALNPPKTGTRACPITTDASDAAEVLLNPGKSTIVTSTLYNCTPGKRCLLLRPGALGALLQFTHKAYEDYVLGCPQPWYLPTLIQVNVFNALVRNGFAMGFSDKWQEENVLSPFTRKGPEQFSIESCPPNLQPTALQRTVPHHPWIDLFPIPQMRDNILRVYGHLNLDELCDDLLDVKPGLDGKPTLLVWGDPSDPSGWEASPDFLRKYGWMLWGCREIFQATNYWRQRRGEKTIVF
ncbi:hypothetical protein AK830_g7206 [Neonectria ditissima]|uniref:Uncharacterized protein n=1 Tax=Neonectria ditissima TaxID=78410 RepID=A0A0P7BGQ3_9HYPO|nr:hypothetical protein AK830_g7206 [Neonectria ditissima]